MAITYIQPAIVNASASYTFASVNATSSITVSGGTVVASVLITAIGYPGDDTAADTAGGQTITLTGSGFAAGASVIINGSAVAVVSVVSSTTITFTSPAQSTGSYPVYVVNTNGSTGIAVPGIQYSGTPTWTTAAGSLGSYTETVAIANTVTATGDAPITYSLYSGSLPTGATLNTSNGYISGTSPLEASPTTFTFTIRATDAQQQDTNRQFSLTINPDVVTWSSPANGTTYTNFTNVAISNVTMSASAASGQSITYTANALPTGLSISGSNIYGTPTEVGNSSSLLTATAATTNKTATRTINWVISVANDTYFPYVSLLLSANTPSSTFVTDASTNNFAITVNGDTRPNNLNPYTAEYYSIYFNGSSYLTAPTSTSTALNFSTGCSIEGWSYITAISNYGFIFDTYQGSGNFTGWWYVGHTNGGNWRISPGNATSVDLSNAMTLNVWNHWAMTNDGTRTRFFVNGVLLYTALVTPQNVDQYFVFSSYGGGYNGSYPITGYVSNQRFIKGASNIPASYQTSSTTVGATIFTPPTSPLTAATGTGLLISQSYRYLDNSTNAFTIATSGSPQISGFEPFTPNSSYSTYGSGYFDGTGDYLTTPTSTGFGFGTGTFTFETWAYPNSNPTNGPGTIIDCRSGTNAEGWVVRIFNDLTVGFYDGPSNAYVNSTGTVKLNAWNHIAIVRSSTSSGGLAFYINGAAAGTATVSSNLGSTWVAMVGNNYTASYAYFGYMTDIRVVKGSAVYTTAFTPPTSPLTAIADTQLLTLQNNQPNTNNMFVDNSTNNLLITRTANSTQGSFNPYAGTWSNYFDGTGDYLTTPVFGSGAGSGLFTTGSTFTIEAWFYQTTYVTTSGYVNTIIGDLTPTTASALWWVVGTDSSNAPVYRWYDGSVKTCTGTVALSTNTWNHIAFVCNSGTLSIYVNGTSQSVTGTTTISTPAGNQSSLVIGADRGYYATGYISNLRVVKNVAVYTTSFTTPAAPLTNITNTQLLTCQSNRLIDNSINNFTITKNGDTTVQKFSPFTVQTATVPTSYSGYFDGSGDYLTLPSSSAFTFGTSDFTIEGWVYIIAGGDKGIFQQGTSSFPTSVTNSVALGITNSSIWQMYAKNAQNNSAATYAVNTWYHFALVRSSSTTTLYLNGTSIITVASDTTNYTGTYFGIGSIYGTSTTNINAYISNLRVVNGTAVYTTTFTPPTSPLTAIANTSLLTLQSTTFIDNSTNNFTITANGDSKPTIQNPFGYTNPSAAVYTASSYGGSMYFDGTGDYVTVANIPNLSSTQNWVVEAWVYPTYLTPSSYNRFVGGGDFNLGQYAGTWYLTNNSAGLLSAGSVAVNAWTHVAVVNKVGTGSYMCINGVIASSIGGASSFTMGNTKIGADVGGASNWYGYVSDFRVINNSTSSVYAANFVPPLAPLTAVQNVTTLVSGASAGIYDSSMINEFESVGNTQISTAVKKYGNASMYFDGTGDYLKTLTAPNLQLNTGNFTIECWSYLTARVNGYPAIFSNYNSFGAGSLALFAGHGSSTTTQYQLAINGSFPAVNAGTIVYNSWVHLAVVRSGSTITLYVNGTSVGTASSSASLNGVGSNFYIGTTGDDLSGGCIQGYLDDFRVTLGVARYTGNFTPSTTPFIQK